MSNNNLKYFKSLWKRENFHSLSTLKKENGVLDWVDLIQLINWYICRNKNNIIKNIFENELVIIYWIVKSDKIIKQFIYWKYILKYYIISFKILIIMSLEMKIRVLLIISSFVIFL